MENVALAALATTAVAFATIAVMWPWRIEAKLKATTKASTISFAGGIDMAGIPGTNDALRIGVGVHDVSVRGMHLRNGGT